MIPVPGHSTEYRGGLGRSKRLPGETGTDGGSDGHTGHSVRQRPLHRWSLLITFLEYKREELLNPISSKIKL